MLKVTWHRQQTTQKVKNAFNTWKAALEHSRITENAFEQMMELHAKHQEQRFASACVLLGKLDRQVGYRVALHKLVERAVESMRTEKIKLLTQQPQHFNSTKY